MFLDSEKFESRTGQEVWVEDKTSKTQEELVYFNFFKSSSGIISFIFKKKGNYSRLTICSNLIARVWVCPPLSEDQKNAIKWLCVLRHVPDELQSIIMEYLERALFYHE
jgi:hypothetical protein